jgi:hypothetical protein
MIDLTSVTIVITLLALAVILLFFQCFVTTTASRFFVAELKDISASLAHIDGHGGTMRRPERVKVRHEE